MGCFHSARVCITFAQAIVCVPIAVYCLLWGPDEEVLSRSRLKVLSLLVVFLGVAAELSVRAGTMWFQQPSFASKRVPYWPLFVGLPRAYPWLIRPLFNNLCSVGGTLGLAVCIYQATLLNLQTGTVSLEDFNVFWLAVFTLLITSLCLLDGWRFIYHHYAITACVAYLFSYPDISLRVMLASLYFWAGITKFFSEGFLEDVVPSFFEPFSTVLEKVGCFKKLDKEIVIRVVRACARVGVGCEALMGLVVWNGSANLRFWACLFNFVMHGYIIVFVGLIGIKQPLPPSLLFAARSARRPRLFLIGWNMMCMTLTQILLSSEHLVPVHWMLFPLKSFSNVVIVVMALLPLTMLFGLCPDPCLAHAYFAPDWFPFDMLLLPSSGGMKLAPSYVQTEGHAFESACLLAKEAMSQSGLSQWVGLDGSWLDRTHLLGGDRVEWANAYNPGPVGFWRMLVDAAGVPCILVKQRAWTGRTYVDSAIVLFPRRAEDYVPPYVPPSRFLAQLRADLTNEDRLMT